MEVGALPPAFPPTIPETTPDQLLALAPWAINDYGNYVSSMITLYEVVEYEMLAKLTDET